MASVLEKTIRGAVTAGITTVAGLNRKRLGSDNAFMRGIHTPMAEELTLENLPVTGTIPAELDGRYVRIGPNPQYGESKGHHWFVGDGMVHGVKLAGPDVARIHIPHLIPPGFHGNWMPTL